MKRLMMLFLAMIAALFLASPALAPAQDGLRSDEEIHDELRVALETQTIDMTFDETEFPDVIDYIGESSGLNIVLDQKVVEDVEDEEITITVRSVTVKNALDIVLNYVELRYTFRYGVILITSPEEAYRGATFLRMYDVRDLTFSVRDFPGTRIRLRGNASGGGGGIIFYDEDEEFEPVTADELEDLIPESVMPESWDENPDAMIMQVAGMLLVRQTREVHREIDHLLSQLRENR